MKRLEQMDKLLEYMSESELLENLVRALSDDEAKDNFEYIARMHDIPFND